MPECFGISLRVTQSAPLMSRRPAANRRELLLPLWVPDRHQTGIAFDPCVPAEPTESIAGKTGEPAEAWNRRAPHCRPAKQTSEPLEEAISELVTGNHLLARLMFQRIRPRTYSGMISEQSCSPHELQRTPTPVASPKIPKPLIDGAEASAPIPSEIETLFTELAHRRLRSGATQEME